MPRRSRHEFAGQQKTTSSVNPLGQSLLPKRLLNSDLMLAEQDLRNETCLTGDQALHAESVRSTRMAKPRVSTSMLPP